MVLRDLGVGLGVGPVLCIGFGVALIVVLCVGLSAGPALSVVLTGSGILGLGL
uniref:Uncharacterized protein n=1 Tax=viral metagenome TaxID=1070528 RepID=A0A6C0HNT1_9ZZZZ